MCFFAGSAALVRTGLGWELDKIGMGMGKINGNRMAGFWLAIEDDGLLSLCLPLW